MKLSRFQLLKGSFVILLTLFAVHTQAAILGQYNISPLPTGAVTRLPATNGNAIVNYLNAPFTQHSVSNFTMRYQLRPTNGWDGVMVRWPDWGGRNLSSVDTFVIGVTGTLHEMKAEFEDTSGDKTIFYFKNVAPTMQYYHISSALVSNIARIKVVAFVTELNTVGPNTNGCFTAWLGGLHYPDTGANSAGPATVMPNNPDAILVGGANASTVLVNTNDSLLEVQYNVTGGGWAGCTILYDNYGTVPIESQDLSGYPHLVFGLYGAPTSLKMEFLDESNKVMDVICTGITAGVQYYSVDTGQFHVDARRIRMINFVVDQGLVGAENYWGSFFVVSGGLDYQVLVNPAGSGPASVLPGKPQVSALGGANPGTTVTQSSTQDFVCAYSVTNGFAGATILFDNYGTPDTNEYQDLSAYSALVFGITGMPEKIGFEIEDVFTNRVNATFLSTRSGAYQYYSVSRNDLTNKGLRMDRVRFINFVVDSNRAGAANMTGVFAVRAGGLYYPWHISASATGTVSRMPPNVEYGAAPVAIGIGGANVENSVQQTNKNILSVNYDVSTGGYCGATILFDNYGTPATNEAANFSAFTAIVFRIRGGTASVNFEVEDSDGNRASGSFTGVNGSWQYFSIPTSGLVQEGVNLNRIRFINFVVDQAAAGAGNYAGAFEVLVEGMYYQLTAGGVTSGVTPTVFPNEPDVLAVGGANPDTEVTQTNSSLIEVGYNVVTGGWSGCTILYDDYGTPATNESQNLSGFSHIVFGLNGDPDRVKVEFVDALGRVMVGNCAAVSNAPVQYYSFATSEFTNDITRISAISFVVDAALAGTGGGSGTLFVVSGGLGVAYTVSPQADGAVTTLPTNPPSVVAIGGGNGEQAADPYSTTMFRVTYNVTTGGFCGGTILYDDYGTVPLESGNFSALTQVMFRISGTPATIGFEFEDTAGVKVVGTLLAVQTGGQYYGIRTADLQGKGLDLAHVRFINFVVDSNRAGAEDLSGWFEVETAGLNFPNYVYRSEDGDTDGLPDEWEGEYGLNSGSGTGDDGPGGDPDDDGADNNSELVAGTSPIDPDSVPEIHVARSGPDIALWMTGVNQRLYQFQRRASMTTGYWENVGEPVRLIANLRVSITQDLQNVAFGFHRCGIRKEAASPMPATPDVIVIGGGNGDTLLTQASPRQFDVQYSVATGFAGATILFDDYGSVPIESADLSGYSEISFGISGDPDSVGYEVEDDAGHRVSGAFRHVDGTTNRYTIPTSLLTAGGVDLAHVRFINFVVDLYKAGAGNETGSFRVESYGLGYVIRPVGQGTGTATALPGTAPVVDNLGGANSADNWVKTGTTNILVNYNVSAGGYEGVSIRYDDYGTPEFESADFSALSSVTFGVQGDAASVKVEFTDVDTNTAQAVFSGITTSYRYFSVPTADLADIGVDITRIRFINFVVDQGLAEAGHYSGSFNIATENLAP